MGTLIVIMYRLGLAIIWLVVLVVVSVMISELANDYHWIGLLIIIAVLIVAVVAHLLLRWILGQKKKPKE